jgi:hypothetical protein
MTRIILLSRNVHWAVLTAVLAAALSTLIGRSVIKIDMSPMHPNRLPLAELCAILSATITAILMRPRFWEWDRSSVTNRRARAIATASAAAGIALPLACVFAVVPGLPSGIAWTWVLTNSLTLAAAIQLLACFIGPLPAGLSTVVLWLLFGLLHNIKPELAPIIPTSGYTEATPHWTIAVAATVLALLAHTWTLGNTRRRS